MKEAVVLNSNVIYASLLKDGKTRKFLAKLFLLSTVDVYAPYRLRKELSSKFGELTIRISRRTGKPIRHITRLLRNVRNFLYSNMRFVRPSLIEQGLTKDPGDADFANLSAGTYTKVMKKVYLVTFNEKHYHKEVLKKRGVIVLTPPDLEKILGLDKINIDLVFSYNRKTGSFLVGVLLGGVDSNELL